MYPCVCIVFTRNMCLPQLYNWIRRYTKHVCLHDPYNAVQFFSFLFIGRHATRHDVPKMQWRSRAFSDVREGFRQQKRWGTCVSSVRNRWQPLSHLRRVSMYKPNVMARIYNTIAMLSQLMYDHILRLIAVLVVVHCRDKRHWKGRADDERIV